MAESIQLDCDGADLLQYKVYLYPSEQSFPFDADAISNSWQQTDDVLAAPMEPLFAQATRPWKRCLDVLGGIAALVLLSPVLLVAAIAVKLTTRGPIFFWQRRSGRGGVPFRMCKFRSMVVDAEAKKKELLSKNEQDGPAFKIRFDPRVTWVGAILRRTSIDELPQLWNVLKGEMSLVGPRPLPCDETAKCLNWQRRRVDVTPGMTCIWQLHGRSKVSFDDWVRMDISYIRELSLVHDIKLLVGTLPVMFWRATGC
jgi:lipopolysaccharide/colanic/teichoic acid biosynthesis glycosyltransferase